ncbi:putative membrane protein [Rickettsia parkeri str. Tate's Hell]|uniref:Membrane protein n=1 Tax=Rickettsia parkeri str. Tate's Hell TaxID=1359189 RepID=A0ABR5DQ49_RICPA|nr:putative membrane protein [Rickettsia parkeri str. AT\
MLKLPHPTKNFISNGYVSIFCFCGGIFVPSHYIFVPN